MLQLLLLIAAAALQRADAVKCYNCYGKDCYDGECEGDFCFIGENPFYSKEIEIPRTPREIKGCILGKDKELDRWFVKHKVCANQFCNANINIKGAEADLNKCVCDTELCPSGACMGKWCEISSIGEETFHFCSSASWEQKHRKGMLCMRLPMLDSLLHVSRYVVADAVICYCNEQPNCNAGEAEIPDKKLSNIELDISFSIEEKVEVRMKGDMWIKGDLEPPKAGFIGIIGPDFEFNTTIVHKKKPVEDTKGKGKQTKHLNNKNKLADKGEEDEQEEEEEEEGKGKEKEKNDNLKNPMHDHAKHVHAANTHSKAEANKQEKQEAKSKASSDSTIIAVFVVLIVVIILAGLAWKFELHKKIFHARYQSVA